jgi:hypothetical protein
MEWVISNICLMLATALEEGTVGGSIPPAKPLLTFYQTNDPRLSLD